jgi:hypothetical protein
MQEFTILYLMMLMTLLTKMVVAWFRFWKLRNDKWNIEIFLRCYSLAIIIRQLQLRDLRI